MEFLEAVPVFARWDLCLFHCSACYLLPDWHPVLRDRICDDLCDCCKNAHLGDPVAGYPSLICVIFMIGGIQLFCSGIVGQYLSRMYLETKKRPPYIIKEKK